MTPDQRTATASQMALMYAEDSRNHHLRILATLPPQHPSRAIYQETVTHLTATIEHIRAREGATS